MGFSKGLKNELETAVANEPPVFEPLKVYSTDFCASLSNMLYSNAHFFWHIHLLGRSFKYTMLQWINVFEGKNAFTAELQWPKHL